MKSHENPWIFPIDSWDVIPSCASPSSQRDAVAVSRPPAIVDHHVVVLRLTEKPADRLGVRKKKKHQMDQWIPRFHIDEDPKYSRNKIIMYVYMCI